MPAGKREGGLLGRLLDRTVFFSFDRSGFLRHARGFDPSALEVDLAGRVMLVTGANSGLGLATARALARLGAEVWLLCRDAKKGEAARDEIRQTTGNPKVHLALVDLASLASVRRCAAGESGFRGERVDVLLHNAGALLDERRETEDGLETTLSVHVVGPFLLTRLLLPRLLAAVRARGEARVLTMSSGGMYARSLELADPQWRERDFSGVKAYAEAKRMQVVLNEEWARRHPEPGLVFAALHPGWVATPGVQRSLPGFWRWMEGRLRTPEQGADTAVWLGAKREPPDSGCFYFDRRPVPTHLLPWTREDEGEAEKLWKCCERWAGLD